MCLEVFNLLLESFEMSEATVTEPTVVDAPAVIVHTPIVADPNTFLVTVDQLDVDKFKNTRTEMVESKVLQMRGSIKESGQWQNIGVSRLDNGMFAVVYGYTRTEAFTRNVYEPLINKWNSDNNVRSADAGFLVVTNPQHREMARKAYPEEFEKQKNKPQNKVLIRIDETVVDDLTAKLANIGENILREDFCLLDLLDGITELAVKYNMSGKDIAKRYKVTDAQVSVLRKVRKVPDALLNLIATAKAGPDGKMEEITEADLVKLKEDASVLVSEILRRMALPKEERETIPVSHLKELAARIVKDDATEIPLTRVQIVEAACKLAGADSKTRKLIKGKESYNFTLFRAELQTQEAEWNKRKEAHAKGEVLPEGTVAVPPAQPSEAGTVDGLAADQAASQAPVNTVNPETPATGTTEAAVANVGTEVAQAGDASAGQPSESKVDELLGVTGDPDEEFTDEQAAVGAKSTKTIIAPEARIKMKSPDLILSSVRTFISTLAEEQDENEEERPAGIIAGCLQATAFGYEMLGMDDERKKAEKVNAEYIDNLEIYITGLEEYAEECFKKSKGMKPFGLQRPDVSMSELLTDVDLDDDDDDDDTDGNAEVAGEASAQTS